MKRLLYLMLCLLWPSVALAQQEIDAGAIYLGPSGTTCLINTTTTTPSSGSTCDLAIDRTAGALWIKNSTSGGWTRIVLQDIANTFTTFQSISSTAPFIYWYETDAGTDLKRWRFVADGAVFRLQTVDDAGSSVLASPVSFVRAGDASFNATVSAVSGFLVNATATSGTFLRCNGTACVLSTLTLPNAATSGDILKASGTNAYASVAPGALTKTDDTNVTLTLGGSATTALVNAASIAAGWTGTLANTRGGCGTDVSAFTTNGVIYKGSSACAATAQGAANAVLTANAGAPAFSATPTVTSLTATSSLTDNGLTAGRFTFAGTSGLLTDDADATFATDTATFTKMIGTTFVQTPLIQTAAATDLTIRPTGNLITDPTGNSILPVTNYDISIGSASLKYLAIDVAELHAQTLVAQSVIATIGGYVVVAPTTLLTANLAPASTTITVKHNNLSNGDRIFLQAAPGGTAQFEAMAVTSSASGSAGAYTYTVTRNLDGTGADQWYSGDAVLDTGTTENGFLELLSGTSILGSGEGPSIIGNVRLSSTYNDVARRFVVGNLNGYYGYSATTYGAAFGNSGATNVTVDATNGFRIRNGTTDLFKADTSGNLSLTGDLVMSTSGVFRAGATAFTTGTGWWLDYNTGTPRFRVGDPSGNRLKWDGTDLELVSQNLTVNASGVAIAAGTTTGTFDAAKSYRFSGLAANSSSGMAGALSSGHLYTVVTSIIDNAATQTAETVLQALCSNCASGGFPDGATLSLTVAQTGTSSAMTGTAKTIVFGSGGLTGGTIGLTTNVSTPSEGTSGSINFGGFTGINATDATTNVVSDLLTIWHLTTGTAAAGFGIGVLFQSESASNAQRDMARIQTKWTTATDASRASSFEIQLVNAASSLTTRFVLDTLGQVYIGRTTATDLCYVCFEASLATYNTFVIKNTDGGNSGTVVDFINSSGNSFGSISQTGATTASFNTSSDARLKKSLAIVTSTDVLSRLVIRDYEWKEDGKKGRGVFAQEAYPVAPFAVTPGIARDETKFLLKDGKRMIDEDPVHVTGIWAVDYSKFVPDLIVGWQQHQAILAPIPAEIADLAAELTALRGRLKDAEDKIKKLEDKK